jgi:hypothetical protein
MAQKTRLMFLACTIQGVTDLGKQILKIYCDQTNSNITTQFLTEHLLTLQIFLHVFSMAATDYVADVHTIL